MNVIRHGEIRVIIYSARMKDLLTGITPKAFTNPSPAETSHGRAEPSHGRAQRAYARAGTFIETRSGGPVTRPISKPFR
jgi:hypothetical protein